MERAVELARQTAERIWERTGVPSMFYGEAATSPAAAGSRTCAPASSKAWSPVPTRRGRPTSARSARTPSAGTIAVGARNVLIAFNVVLASGDLAAARAIARELRERGGGLQTVRALGIALGPNRVQVSCNLTDPGAVPLHRVYGFVRRRAARRGLAVESSETIGLVPRAALQALAAHALDVDPGALATNVTSLDLA